MSTKSSLGTILTLAGINALTFAVAGLYTHYINQNIFAGFTLLGCLAFFAGLTLMRDQLTHN
jgi:formate-dependent nitrite reductase membrane component NrfD